MSRRELRAFSLVEVTLATVIALVVMGGLMSSISSVSRRVRIASIGSDLAISGRTIAKLLEEDFGQAGRGLNDLNALNVSYNFSGSFGETPPARYLYGVGTPGATAPSDPEEASGFSGVVLQWFDYDASRPNSNPSFVVNLPGLAGGSDVWGYVTSPGSTVNLHSNSIGHLAGLTVGDSFLIYKQDIFSQGEEFSAEDAIWNSSVNDPIGDGSNLINSAMVLQIDSISGILNHPDQDLPGQYMTVTFGPGSIFDTNILNPEQITWQPYNFPGPPPGSLMEAMKDAGVGQPKLPSTIFMARKLGDADSFNHVEYRVLTNGTENYLARIRNGTKEIIGTNVTKFEVWLGMDVPIQAPSSVTRDQMDGQVSISDTAAWDKVENFSLSDDDKSLIGRHAVSAEIHFQQKSVTQDRVGFKNPDKLKVRSFVKQFRIWNNTIPVPSL